MDILTFYNQDESTNKPKLIKKGGKFTKTFLKYNRQKILSGEVNNYIDPDNIFNPITGRTIKIKFDRRYKDKKIITKNFKKKFNPKKGIIKLRNTLKGFFGTSSNVGHKFLKNILKENLITSGKYKLVLSFDNTIFYDNTIDISGSVNRWWKENYTSFLVGDTDNEDYYWDVIRNNEDLPIDYYIGKETKLTKKQVNQIFRDGEDYYCFYTAIINYFNDRLEKSSGRAKKIIEGKLNYLQGRELKSGFKYGILQKYNGGMPEDKNLLSDMANRLNVGFDIEQPFMDETFIKIRPLKPVKKVFKYINSRLNHLQTIEKNGIFNNLYMNDYKQVEYKTRQELYKIIEDNKKNDNLTIYGKDSLGVSIVKTSKNYYSLYSEFEDTVNDFEKEIGFTENIKIDAIENPDLTQYLKQATHYNITYDILDTKNINAFDSNIGHLDLIKAYSQFYNSKYYDGFMGIITSGIRPMDSYKGYKGCFYITDLELTGKFKKLNEKLGFIYHSNNIYYDSELKFLEDNGATFKIKYGVIGENFDFRFTDDMLNKKDIIEVGDRKIKVPFYSKWCGKMGALHYEKKFYMKGKKDYFENLRTEANIFNTDEDEFKISYNKKVVKHAIHITGQITAYQRLNMLEQLIEMDSNKLIRVVCDGIYYYKHNFKIYENKFHIDKDKKDFNKWEGGDCFTTNNYDYKNWKCKNIKREYNRIETHLGGGGAGKTHYNLMDKGLINPCYIAPSWFLSCEKKEEYKLKNNNVLARLTDTQLPYWKEIMNRFNNLILDEISMYSEKQAQFIIDNFKGGIYFCGDLGFQLPPPNGLKEMKAQGKIIKHEKLYRFKCSKLLNLVKYIRSIREEEIKGKKISSLEFIINQFQKIDFEEVKKIYKVEDLIITSENKFIEEIDLQIQEDKFLVKNNTSLYKNGQILLKNPNIQGVEIERHNAFTIHKSQGKTTETKLFIDSRKIKSLRMLYTAITRARYWNQIYFF